MRIEKRKQLQVGKIYTIYDARLAQSMTKINLSKPCEYIFDGLQNGQLLFRRKLKGDKFSSIHKKVYCGDDIESTVWVKINDSFAEACELFDNDIEMAKEKLYKSSILMKKLHDELDEKKIYLRKNKLNRLV